MRTVDPVLHRQIMRKIDTAVSGCFGLMYLLAYLDRNNMVRTDARS